MHASTSLSSGIDLNWKNSWSIFATTVFLSLNLRALTWALPDCFYLQRLNIRWDLALLHQAWFYQIHKSRSIWVRLIATVMLSFKMALPFSSANTVICVYSNAFLEIILEESFLSRFKMKLLIVLFLLILIFLAEFSSTKISATSAEIPLRKYVRLLLLINLVCKTFNWASSKYTLL